MPTVSGFTTVADLVDGLAGATIVFSNEAHVFTADAEGAIAVGTTGRNLPDYSNQVSIYNGSTQATYADLAVPTDNNTWTVAGSADVAGEAYRTLDLTNDLQLRIADTTGTMTLHDRNTATTGFVDIGGADNILLIIPIVIRISGTNVTYNRSLSLAKALGGSAPFIRMEATRQTVAYDFGGDDPQTGQPDIVFTATSFNFSGTPAGVWRFSVDGAAFQTITSGAGMTIVGANTDSSTLTLTSAGYDGHLGDGSVVTYRFERTSMGASASADQVSVVKLEDADAGGAVVIAVLAGSAILKNNPTYSASDTSTFVDLEAQLYVGGNRVNDTFFTTGIDRGTLTFAWSKNNVLIPATGAGSLQLVAQPANYGRQAYRIRVIGLDIEDGGTETYSCAVTYI